MKKLSRRWYGEWSGSWKRPSSKPAAAVKAPDQRVPTTVEEADWLIENKEFANSFVDINEATSLTKIIASTAVPPAMPPELPITQPGRWMLVVEAKGGVHQRYNNLSGV
jgi:hypothetical protein